MILALWGPGWTRLPFCLLLRREVLAQRGHAPSPTTTASACLGVHDGDHGPFRRPPENGLCAGEKPAGFGSVSFGGSDGLVCLSATEIADATHQPRL
jgi:hypothetical protein